ncbi:hypothetical protein [Helicobacter ganmani]|uniref:hypothetical protein n=1 Tax=Helicobacter ganmani TaxID=60246 RepID=UPI003A895B11
MSNIALILLGAGDSSRFCLSALSSSETIHKSVQKLRLPKKQWLRVGEIPLWLMRNFCLIT